MQRRSDEGLWTRKAARLLEREGVSTKAANREEMAHLLRNAAKPRLSSNITFRGTSPKQSKQCCMQNIRLKGTPRLAQRYI